MVIRSRGSQESAGPLNGTSGGYDAQGLLGKDAQVNWRSVNNCLGLCNFLPYGFDRTVELLRGVTGWDANLYEMMRVGERMNTLCRALNVREGMSARDDTLPKRFFQQIGDPKPTTDPLDPREFEAAKQFYYAAMGWTPDGIPTRHKLDELGVGWAYELMEEGRRAPSGSSR